MSTARRAFRPSLDSARLDILVYAAALRKERMAHQNARAARPASATRLTASRRVGEIPQEQGPRRGDFVGERVDRGHGRG